MSWAKLDDGYHSHQKTHACSLEALGVFSLLLSWSADHETNGRVPGHMLVNLSRGNFTAVNELVIVGFIERQGDEAVIHHYLRYNPSAAKLTKQRKAHAKAQKKWTGNRDRVLIDQRSITERSNSTGRDGSGLRPSRPSEPTIVSQEVLQLGGGPGEGSGQEAVRRERKARRVGAPTLWPEGFALTDDLRRWAAAGGLDAELEWTQFSLHHQSKGSRFVDWPKAFKGWCMRSKLQFGRGKGARA